MGEGGGARGCVRARARAGGHALTLRLHPSPTPHSARYVQCYSCGNPETVVKVKREDISLKCKACGQVSNVDPRYKLNTFIIKNPPENPLSKAERKCVQRGAIGGGGGGGRTHARCRPSAQAWRLERWPPPRARHHHHHPPRPPLRRRVKKLEKERMKGLEDSGEKKEKKEKKDKKKK